MPQDTTIPTQTTETNPDKPNPNFTKINNDSGNQEINDQNQPMELSDDILSELNPLSEGDTISQQQLASWQQTNKRLYSQAAARRLPQTNSYSNNLWIEELTNELEKRKSKLFDHSM